MELNYLLKYKFQLQTIMQETRQYVCKAVDNF